MLNDKAQGKNDSSRVCSDIYPVSSNMKDGYKKADEELFTKLCSNRTKRNRFKLEGGRFTLGIRKTFFTVRVARYWNRLLRSPPWRC